MLSIPTGDALKLISASASSGARSLAHLFWVLLTRVTTLSTAVALVAGVFFLQVHCLALAWLSAAGAACYCSCRYLLRQRRNHLALTLLWGGVFVHATTGTLLSGWSSGFHYYMLTVAPTMIIASPRRNALWLLASLWCFYLALFFITLRIPPLQPMTASTLAIVQAFNASVLFGIVTYFTFIYREAANLSSQRLRLLATTDPLTGLFNRRYANEMISREAKHVDRGSRPLSFILADIDHFKAINDRYGHDVGDAVLVGVSKALSEITRSETILSRWGGEEFLLVLPATSRQGAVILAERIHRMMQGLRLPIGDAELQVSLTMGVSAMEPGESWGMALIRADQALYDGKHAGRNCIKIDRTLSQEVQPQCDAA